MIAIYAYIVAGKVIVDAFRDRHLIRRKLHWRAVVENAFKDAIWVESADGGHWSVFVKATFSQKRGLEATR